MIKEWDISKRYGVAYTLHGESFTFTTDDFEFVLRLYHAINSHDKCEFVVFDSKLNTIIRIG